MVLSAAQHLTLMKQCLLQGSFGLKSQSNKMNDGLMSCVSMPRVTCGLKFHSLVKLDAGYPESIKDMFDVIVEMSNVGRTFTPDIFVHQCCQRSLHIFSVMRCIKDS